MPIAGYSHRRYTINFFFSIHKLFKASKYKPILREENRIKTQGFLYNLALNSSLFGQYNEFALWDHRIG